MPFFTDLELPEYVVSLKIPTKYEQRISLKINTAYETLYANNSDEDRFLIAQMKVFTQPKFVDRSTNIKITEYSFISPWQLASSLYQMLEVAIQQQIEEEKESGLFARSDLEDFFTVTEYGITEDPANMDIRTTAEKAIKDRLNQEGMQQLARKEALELAELEEARLAQTPSTKPNEDELALAGEREEELAAASASYSPDSMVAQEGQNEAAPSAGSEGATPPSDGATTKSTTSAAGSKGTTPPSDGVTTKSTTSAAAVESDSENQLQVPETSPLTAGTKRRRATESGESSRKSFAEAVRSRQSHRPGSFAEAVEISRKDQQEISQSL